MTASKLKDFGLKKRIFKENSSDISQRFNYLPLYMKIAQNRFTKFFIGEYSLSLRLSMNDGNRDFPKNSSPKNFR